MKELFSVTMIHFIPFSSPRFHLYNLIVQVAVIQSSRAESITNESSTRSSATDSGSTGSSATDSGSTGGSATDSGFKWESGKEVLPRRTPVIPSGDTTTKFRAFETKKTDLVDSRNPTSGVDVVYWQSTSAIILFKYASPFLIVIGTVGNLVAVVSLQSSIFKASSTSFILSALALCDVFVLNTGLMRWWLKYFSRVDLRKLSRYGCKLHLLFTYFSHQIASWTLVLLTFERTISVVYPLRCKRLCSRKRIIAVWSGIALCLFAANIHYFISSDIIPIDSPDSGNLTGTAYKCDTIPSWRWFLDGPWTWIDACLGDFFPFLIVFVGNTIIVFHLLRAKRARSSELRVKAKNGGKLKSTTATLILVSVIFLVLNIPMDLNFIGEGYGLFPLNTDEELAVSDFRFAIVSMMYYGNNAIEFVLYFISGRKFRSAFIDMFGCGRWRPRLNSKHTKSTVINSSGSGKF